MDLRYNEICPECWGRGDDGITGESCYRCDGAGWIMLDEEPDGDDDDREDDWDLDWGPDGGEPDPEKREEEP